MAEEPTVTPSTKREATAEGYKVISVLPDGTEVHVEHVLKPEEL